MNIRDPQAFAQLVADWQGLLVSDGYSVYQSWQGLRQSCLAHLLRTAKGLAEHVDAGIARCGGRLHAELQRLCHMGTARPTVGQWRAWYARFRHLLAQHATREDKAGTFARRLAREGEALWAFLDVPGVEATNNIVERAHRFGGVVAQTQPGHVQREGQSLGGARAVFAAHLSHSGATNVSDAGRSGDMPVQRHRA